MAKMKCAVIGCRNKIKFTFPKSKSLRDKWLIAVDRPCFVPKDNHGLCDEHFSPDELTTENKQGGTYENLLVLSLLSEILSQF